MNYSEFFQKFYFTRSEGGLVGSKSQLKIPKFFVENALDRDYWENLPSDSAYEKWFKSGERGQNPKDVWTLLNNHFDDKALCRKLRDDLNESKKEEIASRFGIDCSSEEVDKERFINAIVVQFKAIASGNGVAKNVVPETYTNKQSKDTWSDYPFRAKSKFQNIRLPGEDEYPLQDFYVCNNIGTTAVVFPHKARGKYIEDVTLSKIRNFDPRGVTDNAILIGACGYGKTTMMQHLFLDAVDQCSKTGYFPIFAELRNFSDKYKDLIDFLVEVVNDYDESFSVETAKDIFLKQRGQILLDGLDEMDPDETEYFQAKLASFRNHFPKNQIVISSRQCVAITGIRQFQRFYIQPLDDTQTEELVGKLLSHNKEKVDKVLSFLEPRKGFIKKNGFIATNPMLLTIITRNCEELQSIGRSKTKFYELMYRMLIEQHDAEKEAFGRFFHSVSDSYEFTLVYREFCAESYMDGVFEFDNRTFEKYFRKIKSKTTLSNPNKFKLAAFQRDVCATACMMYEQESGIYYIDPGFQDYFFAEYYYQEDTPQSIKIGRELWNRKTDSFRNLDALYMLFEMSKEKVEVCILLPYLDSIFKGKSDEEALMRFLHYGFGDIKYSLLDKPKIDEYIKKGKTVEKCDFIPATNYPKNIVMGFLCDVLELPNTFTIGAFEDIVEQSDATHFYAGYYDSDRSEEDWWKKGPKWLRTSQYDIAHKNDPHYFQSLEYMPFPLIDNTGVPVCFGYVYSVDPLSLLDKEEEMKEFLDLCESASVKEIFMEVKEYYKEISEEQRENEYR